MAKLKSRNVVRPVFAGGQAGLGLGPGWVKAGAGGASPPALPTRSSGLRINVLYNRTTRPEVVSVNEPVPPTPPL